MSSVAQPQHSPRPNATVPAARLSPASRKPRPAGAFPTWAGIAIVALFLSLGTVVSLLQESFGLFYTVLFAAGAVIATLAVNLQGLYLTVATIPILFAVFTYVTGVGLSSSAALEGSHTFSTTTVLAAIYPLIEKFPLLLVVTLSCAILALLRLLRGRQAASTTRQQEQTGRQVKAAANRRNAEISNKVRLTVAELAERSKRDKELSASHRAARGQSHQHRQERTATEPPRSGRLREQDREQRRREQEARAARQVASYSSDGSGISNASASTANPLPPFRPDPHRRAGDTPVIQPPRSIRPESTPVPDTPSWRRRMDDDLYRSTEN